MAFVEIERKFLVDGDFRKDVRESSRIVQGYLSTVPGRTVRVRARGDKAYITVKGAAEGLSRFEWEKEIALDEAMLLLKLCDPVIDKTRHLVDSTDGVHVWEVDEFHGDNDGLIVAEVELSSENEDFPRPDWLGKEVTDDRRYYNSCLTQNPYKNWK